MRFIYTLILYLLTPLIVLRLLWRSRHAPDYRRRWGERFGQLKNTAREPVVWVHAVSVGETLAALPVIHALLERRLPVLVTTMTPTGSQRVRAALGERVQHVYLPYDYPFAMRRFLQTFQPRLGIVMETELWPNLLHQCRRQAIPVMLANARLSERSAQRYAYVPGLSRAMLRNLAAIAAQGEADAMRLRALGADPATLTVTGSIKFDINLPEHLAAQAQTLRRQWGKDRPVWIAASTHEGEESQVLQAFSRIRPPDCLLVLVPRHPERFARVAELCRTEGFTVARRSLQQTCSPDIAVYLGDTMGELLLMYAAADVAFIGGSLVPTGGHNPLEPAALGLPVVFGPQMFNFADISQRLLASEAARQVDSVAGLATVIGEFLQDSALRHETGARGQAFVAANQGALARLLGIVERFLDG